MKKSIVTILPPENASVRTPDLIPVSPQNPRVCVSVCIIMIGAYLSICACQAICRLDTICYYTGGSHVTTPCYTSYTIVKLCTRLHLLLIHLAVYFSLVAHILCAHYSTFFLLLLIDWTFLSCLISQALLCTIVMITKCL